MSPPAPAEVLDPVAAYDRLAAVYGAVSERRRRYLAGIEGLIAARVPPGSRSLLDVGAGDGQRTLRLARQAGLSEVICLEPSEAMSRNLPGALRWAIRAEELDADGPPAAGRSFDVITCLWNVLGHVRPERARIGVLRQLGRLLSPRGLLFLDVNHRYNAREYGRLRTVLRCLRDLLAPDERNGDVTVRFSQGGVRCACYGHVFTGAEVRRIVRAAGLALEERLVVDYGTGQETRSPFSGNLLLAVGRRGAARRNV